MTKLLRIKRQNSYAINPGDPLDNDLDLLEDKYRNLYGFSTKEIREIIALKLKNRGLDWRLIIKGGDKKCKNPNGSQQAKSRNNRIRYGVNPLGH